jgi:hypothetical protein
MANVYGSRNKNQFPLPSVESGETYYTLVNTENGEITLKRLNRLIPDSKIGGFAEAQDQTVGTIPATGPNKGKFIPNEGIFGVGGITETERKAFAQQPQALQEVKKKALQTSGNAQRTISTEQGIPVNENAIAARSNQLANNGVATTPLSGDPQASSINAESFGEGVSKLNEYKIAGSTKTRAVTQYPDNSLLRYPIDMDKTQDYMQFTMLEYRPRKLDINVTRGGGAFVDRPEAKNENEIQTRGKTVVLPIQPSITDANTVRWQEDSMNSLEAIAAAAALSTIQNGVGGAVEAATGVASIIAGNNPFLGNVAAAFFAQQASGVKGLLPRTLGGILNPNIELLFEGPQLRTFQFNIVLSAREENESKNIRNIIRFFKQGMSVKRAQTDLFLKAPHTFEIKYIYGLTQKDHPWINRIKECALTGCTVNYTPAGSYATFGDGAMTSYEIGLQFAELEAIYDDDYKNSGGKGNESEIGY